MDGVQRAGEAPDPRDPRDDTALVLAARGDDPAAYGELFRRWFDRCFDVAWNISRNRETAAEVTQDAFLAGWEGLGDLRDPSAFGGWILRSTRNRALNRLARDRGKQLEPLEVHTEERWAMTDEQADPAAATEIGDRQRLVWTAARVLGERDLSLLDLHLRHGLEPAEIAAELGVTPNNAHQLLFRLRGKLKDAVGAALLWREGRPTCPALASLVPAQGRFDGPTSALVRRHQKDCRPCTAKLAGQTHPERLFAALPIAVVPLALRDQVQAGLAELGVPVQGVRTAPTSSSWAETPPDAPTAGAGSCRRPVRRRRVAAGPAARWPWPRPSPWSPPAPSRRSRCRAGASRCSSAAARRPLARRRRAPGRGRRSPRAAPGRAAPGRATRPDRRAPPPRTIPPPARRPATRRPARRPDRRPPGRVRRRRPPPSRPPGRSGRRRGSASR